MKQSEIWSAFIAFLDKNVDQEIHSGNNDRSDWKIHPEVIAVVVVHKLPSRVKIKQAFTEVLKPYMTNSDSNSAKEPSNRNLRNCESTSANSSGDLKAGQVRQEFQKPLRCVYERCQEEFPDLCSLASHFVIHTKGKPACELSETRLLDKKTEEIRLPQPNFSSTSSSGSNSTSGSTLNFNCSPRVQRIERRRTKKCSCCDDLNDTIKLATKVDGNVGPDWKLHPDVRVAVLLKKLKPDSIQTEIEPGKSINGINKFKYSAKSELKNQKQRNRRIRMPKKFVDYVCKDADEMAADSNPNANINLIWPVGSTSASTSINLGWNRNSNKTLNCDFKGCAKRFRFPLNLTRHLKSHDGRNNSETYKCVICGQKLSSDSNLHLHMQIHIGEKLHKCDTCEKQFKHASGLRIHMGTHLQNRKRRLFKCGVCGKRFSQFLNMNLHMIMIHTGEEAYTSSDYKCEFCTKRCSGFGELQKHLLTHRRKTV